MRTIDAAERRARLGIRHHLTKHVTMVDAARSLVGIHSTDPGSVYLATFARAGADVTAIEHDLYAGGELVRMLGMRRTLFVVLREVVPVIQAACTDSIAAGMRKRIVKTFVEEGGIAPDGSKWLRQAEKATLNVLAEMGEAAGAELSKKVPALRAQFTYAEGKAYGGPQNIASQVLSLLGAEGRIVRCRPRGTWISGQYRWTTLHPPIEEVPVEEAQAELVRRWLRSYGPGTANDLKWWAGWTVRDTRRALANVGAIEVDLEGAVGYLLPDDLDRVKAPKPWVALLPALDSTPMGWTDRTWYLGEHKAACFDRNGNVGPTVWADGRIVGGWTQRKDGEVVTRLLEDVGRDRKTKIEAAAARVQRWLGDVRVTPRFRTPLEQELSR